MENNNVIVFSVSQICSPEYNKAFTSILHLPKEKRRTHYLHVNLLKMRKTTDGKKGGKNTNKKTVKKVEIKSAT